LIEVKIAVASGKGGTGKTTVSINLALSLDNVQYLDCDVEEPNAAIFLKPEISKKIAVEIPVPVIDEGKCDFCRKCAQLCAFNALVVLAETTLLFPEMCHGCGGCAYICPQHAITEQNRKIGIVERGTSGNIDFIQGLLNVGEPMAPPIIKKERSLIDDSKTVILDSPPGTSCPVIETIRDTDFCILVTEPTPFGLNDLVLAVETVRGIRVPFGVIINQDGIGDDEVDKYCNKEGIEVLMKIPWDRRIAEAYSRGEPAVKVFPEMKKDFQDVFEKIKKTVTC
jgi:MinD superfamily P-loop ATPase